MKYLFLLAFLVTAIVSCTKADPKARITPANELASTKDFIASPDQDTARHIPLYIHKIPAEAEINDTLTAVGGYSQALPPPMGHAIAQALCGSYWVVEGYNDSRASRPQKIAGTGQWIKCHPDGTFAGGHWGKQTYAGVWYLTFNEKHPLLQLDANVDRMDAFWDIQGFRKDEGVMVLTRRNTFGLRHNSISAKWIALYDLPTREQFELVHQGLD